MLVQLELVSQVPAAGRLPPNRRQTQQLVNYHVNITLGRFTLSRGGVCRRHPNSSAPPSSAMSFAKPSRPSLQSLLASTATVGLPSPSLSSLSSAMCFFCVQCYLTALTALSAFPALKHFSMSIFLKTIDNFALHVSHTRVGMPTGCGQESSRSFKGTRSLNKTTS